MSVLDKAITVPGIGIRLTLRGAIQMLCQLGSVNDDLCRLIQRSPEQACQELFSKYGESWVKKQLNDAFYLLIGSTLEQLGCPKDSNWQDIVLNAIDIELSPSGVDFDIDFEALSRNFVCMVANKAIAKPFGAVVETITRELKNACKVLSSSSSTATSAGGSKQDAVKGSLQTVMDAIARQQAQQAQSSAPPRSSAPGATQEKSKSLLPLFAALTLTAGGAIFILRRR